MAHSYLLRSLTIAVLAIAACTPAPAARPVARASHGPDPLAATASTAPGTSPLPARKLRRPPGELVTLAGSVALDGVFLASSGHGSLVSEHGAGIVANNGGGVISDNGAGVVALAGSGRLVAGAAGNVISNNAGNILAEDDGNVVAGPLGAAAFGLLEAAPAPATGELSPVAGMRLTVRNLLTGLSLDLGVDPDGKPVQAVYSNAHGRFEVYLPTDVAGNVRVDVTLPEGSDPRLALELLTPGKPANAATVDEDTSLVSRLIRVTFTGKYTDLLSSVLIDHKSAEEITTQVLHRESTGGATGQLIQLVVKELTDHGAGKTWTPAMTARVAARVTELMLAKLDLAKLVKRPPLTGQVVPALVDELRRARRKAAEAMAREPGYFKLRPPYSEAHVSIEKPSDVTEFFVDQYFTHFDAHQATIPAAVLLEAGYTAEEAEAYNTDLGQCNDAISEAFTLLLLSDDDVRQGLESSLEAG
ncbi:MAG: hypothetical protein JWM80_6607 [Cyanobacteria bacterium RYN_339]|nr:hypothetical protein [Cyanobacteria bacterium RYN_339]